MNNKIKKVATEAVKKSGKMLIKEFENFDRRTVKLKSHHELITKCDLASEKIIIDAVRKNFPDHKVLSEESGKLKGEGEYLWIIDPIDGTTNFSIHNPLWCISVGVARIDKNGKKKMELGFVYAPVLNEMFVAEIGKGATLNDKKIQPSRISKGKVLNAFCHSTNPKDIKKAIKYYSYQKLHDFDCRQMGSAAIELAYVACGRIESIMIPGANPWDVAAGALLINEAGGKVTDFKGKKWNLDSKDIFASNGLVHSRLLKVINRK